VVAVQSLADVVQQGPEEEQVGARHVAGVPGGRGDRLDEVPVERVAVHRVVLRRAADARPFR